MRTGRKAGAHFEGVKPIEIAPEVAFEGALGWERVLTFPDEKPYRLDLEFLRPFGRLGEALAAGLYSYARNKRRGTIKQVKQLMLKFGGYLAWAIARGELSNNPNPAALTSNLLAGFAQWLHEGNYKGNRVSIGSASITHRLSMQIVRHASSSPGFAGEFLPDLVLATNPMGFSLSLESVVDRAQPLNEANYKLVRKAAAEDVLAIMNDPQRPSYPNKAHLLPFWLILVIDTAANPSSVACLFRNCIRDHYFDPRQRIIIFPKPRGGDGNAAEYPFPIHDSKDPLAPCNVIRFLLVWTEALVQRVAKYDSNKLFLYRTDRRHASDHLGNRHKDHSFDSNSVAGRELFGSFISAHGLAPFQTRSLRETSFFHDWVRNRSVLRIQKRANHKNARTTLRYLRSKRIVDAREEEMVAGLAAMREAYTTKGTPVVTSEPRAEAVARDETLSPETRANIVTGKFNTGMTDCSDPYNSPQPNQKPGRLCSAFWACIRCKCAHFYLEHLPVLLAQKRVLIESEDDVTKGMWPTLFGPILKDIDGIIGKFSAADIQTAEQRVTDADIIAARVQLNAHYKPPIPAPPLRRGGTRCYNRFNHDGPSIISYALWPASGAS